MNSVAILIISKGFNTDFNMDDKKNKATENEFAWNKKLAKPRDWSPQLSQI